MSRPGFDGKQNSGRTALFNAVPVHCGAATLVPLGRKKLIALDNQYISIEITP
ncbi:MAG: hypothetical protein ACOH2H_23055 [Cypionkella sp.]